MNNEYFAKFAEARLTAEGMVVDFNKYPPEKAKYGFIGFSISNSGQYPAISVMTKVPHKSAKSDSTIDQDFIYFNVQDGVLKLYTDGNDFSDSAKPYIPSLISILSNEAKTHGIASDGVLHSDVDLFGPDDDLERSDIDYASEFANFIRQVEFRLCRFGHPRSADCFLWLEGGPDMLIDAEVNTKSILDTYTDEYSSHIKITMSYQFGEDEQEIFSSDLNFNIVDREITADTSDVLMKGWYDDDCEYCYELVDDPLLNAINRSCQDAALREVESLIRVFKTPLVEKVSFPVPDDRPHTTPLAAHFRKQFVANADTLFRGVISDSARCDANAQVARIFNALTDFTQSPQAVSIRSDGPLFIEARGIRDFVIQVAISEKLSFELFTEEPDGSLKLFGVDNRHACIERDDIEALDLRLQDIRLPDAVFKAFGRRSISITADGTKRKRPQIECRDKSFSESPSMGRGR